MLGTSLKRSFAILHSMLTARTVHQSVLVNTRLDACDFLNFHNLIIAQRVRHLPPHLKFFLMLVDATKRALTLLNLMHTGGTTHQAVFVYPCFDLLHTIRYHRNGCLSTPRRHFVNNFLVGTPRAARRRKSLSIKELRGAVSPAPRVLAYRVAAQVLI